MATHKIRTFILALIGISVLLSIVVATAKRPTEPSYQGRRLSEWLSDRHFTEGGQIVLSDVSVQAVQAIGTNALPSLMAMLRSSDSQMKLQVIMLVERQRLLRVHIPTKGERQIAAMYGFRALGLAAKPVFPQIVDLVLGTDFNGQAINALTESDADTIAALAKGLENRDPKIRVRAAFALGCLRQAPAISLPALTQALKDPDSEVRAQAAGSLGPYGGAAQSLVPQLTAAKQDTDPRVSGAAAQALQTIAAITERQRQ